MLRRDRWSSLTEHSSACQVAAWFEHRFVFWYLRRQPGVRSQASYEEIIKIVEFSTIEDFWVCYCHFARVSSMPNPTNLHVFKESIRPLWEDPGNRSEQVQAC